jgi:hypothetical protein
MQNKDAAMNDVTNPTPSESQALVDRLSKLPLDELRRRMDLVGAQIEWATRQKNDAALANLQAMKEHLLLALKAAAMEQGRGPKNP